MRRTVIPAIFCAVLGLASITFAQRSLPLQLQAQVEPAFRITPMVQTFEAPRGKLIEFEFEIESLERPTSLRIMPVGLRKQENGVIMPDETAPLADAVRLLSPSASTNRFGVITANVRLANGEIRTQSLTVAALARVEDTPKLATEPLRWDASGTKPGFVVCVMNQGDVHVPLDGKLTVSNALGQSAEFLAGYGRWLLPGQSDDLRFHMPGPLPPGTYHYHAEIDIGEGRTPVAVEDKFRVEAQAEPPIEDAAS